MKRALIAIALFAALASCQPSNDSSNNQPQGLVSSTPVLTANGDSAIICHCIALRGKQCPATGQVIVVPYPSSYYDVHKGHGDIDGTCQ